MSMFTRVVVALCLLSLGGCYRSVRLDVRETNDGRVAMRVHSGDEAPACISSLEIGDGTPHGARWVVEQLPYTDVCHKEIVYPEVPRGFELRANAPLESGRRYTVFAEGFAFMSSARFTRRTRPHEAPRSSPVQPVP